jgi:hypothetical protein
MKEYTKFHDGSFAGLWIDGRTVHIFLATERREQFTAVAAGVEALAVNGVKAGNIIFEVLERGLDEILPDDIKVLYALREGPPGAAQIAALLEKVNTQGWKILEIEPSYGASCLVLASSIDVVRREEWLEQYVAT